MGEIKHIGNISVPVRFLFFSKYIAIEWSEWVMNFLVCEARAVVGNLEGRIISDSRGPPELDHLHPDYNRERPFTIQFAIGTIYYGVSTTSYPST